MKYLKTFEDIKSDNKNKQPSDESNHTEDCQCSTCEKKREDEEKIKSSTES